MIRDVAVVAYPGVSTFGLGVTAEVFGSDREVAGLPRFRYRVAGVARGEMRTDTGLRFRPDAGLRAVAEADLAIVVCWNPALAVPPALLRALRATVSNGGRVMSHCTGAFVLAEAGLLDGRRATTHWMHAAELAARYPEVQVVPNVLYVDAGPVLTSAGTAAGIDACLHLLRSEFGARAANEVARRMVVPPHRDGGQSQYEQHAHPVPGPRENGLADTMSWALAHLGEPMTVEQLARQASMSPRNFARRFAQVAGTTPHAWLVGQRLLRAQELLEASSLPVERVARNCGLSPPVLRHHFACAFGNSPTGYRRAFRLG